MKDSLTRALWVHLLAVFGWGALWYGVTNFAPEHTNLALHGGICLLLILTAKAHFTAIRAGIASRRAVEDAEQVRQGAMKMIGSNVLELLDRIGKSEERADACLQKLNARCEALGKGLVEASWLREQVAKQRDFQESMRTQVAELAKRAAGGSACPESGRGVPYAPQGLCRDAADADGAIFDALELVAKGEIRVPEHIEVGDHVIFDGNGVFGAGNKMHVAVVVGTSPARVKVDALDARFKSLSVSRDYILAHRPKEA